MYLTNVEGHDEDDLLETIKAFHNLEEEEKEKMKLEHFNKKNKNKVRGLMPFMENDPSFKELYDKGMPLRLVDR